MNFLWTCAMSTKRVIVQMTDDQVAWLDSLVQPMGSRAAVIRKLIEEERQREASQVRDTQRQLPAIQ